MRKIFVVGRDDDYANWMQGTIVSKLKDADLVVFTGGEDVDPNLYNENKNPRTYSNIQRDLYEQIYFNEAITLKKHIIGICRGSQFLCVMNGGRLVQHQENPSSVHKITTYDDNEILITSSHHQAAYPWNLSQDKFKLLAWTIGISDTHQDGNQKELNVEQECEIVYYPQTRCLGIQGHPEWMDSKSISVIYLQNMLNQFMANELLKEKVY